MFSATRLAAFAVAALSLVAVHAAPGSLFARTIPAIQNDLATLSSKITAISSASIFAQSNTTPVLSLAVVNAITALDTTAKQAITDTVGTAAFTAAQCTQLLQATTPLVPNTLSNSLPQLVLARNSLLLNGFLASALTALNASKTDLHTFIGDLGAKCPAAQLSAALAIQAQTDTIIANTLAQL